MSSLILAVLSVCVCCVHAASSGNRYGFYRAAGGRRAEGGGTRRVFGGKAAPQDAFPAACVLLDRYMAPRCSGSVLAEKWALTAAHCVTPHLAYVKYNTRRPAEGGDTAPVLVLYRHPEYRVVQEDLGRGTDVTLLHHDVGLVRTRTGMRLSASPALSPLRAMTLYSVRDIAGQEVQVLGFGRTEAAAQGEELVAARLRVVSCERGSWLHCACGAAAGDGRAAGVCSGDSGGPVLYRGAQLAVTSMGPVECVTPGAGAGAGAGAARPPETATSVFTALYEYAPLVNATILDTEDAIRMTRLHNDADTLHLAARVALFTALTAHLSSNYCFIFV